MRQRMQLLPIDFETLFAVVPAKVIIYRRAWRFHTQFLIRQRCQIVFLVHDDHAIQVTIRIKGSATWCMLLAQLSQVISCRHISSVMLLSDHGLAAVAIEILHEVLGAASIVATTPLPTHSFACTLSQQVGARLNIAAHSADNIGKLTMVIRFIGYNSARSAHLQVLFG